MGSAILAVEEPRSFAFGPFVLKPERQLLTQGETVVRLGSRALDLLTALVERPGELVPKRELIARAWPDTFVEEGNLKVNMNALRRALGDDMNATQYIATVIGRGYRFVAPVRRSAPADATFAVSAAIPATDISREMAHLVGKARAIAAVRGEWDGARLVASFDRIDVSKMIEALAVDEAWLHDRQVIECLFSAMHRQRSPFAA